MLTGKKFQILCDIDDVLEDLLSVWLMLLNAIHQGKNAFVPKAPEDITEWNLRKAFPSLSEEDLYQPLRGPLAFELLKPLPHAPTTLAKWCSNPDLAVKLVSASHYSAIPNKVDFLKRFYPFIKWPQIIICTEKQDIFGNVLIDDGPHNLIEGSYAGVLFSKPHNRSFDAEKHNIQRASDWWQIEKIVDKMISEYFSEMQ